MGRDGADSLTYQLNDTQVSRFREDAVDQAMLVIRRRIDKWGVAEVDVRKLGTDSIQISLPGQQDPEQAKELIGTTAQLEFRMVDDTSDLLQRQLVASAPARRQTRASRLVQHQRLPSSWRAKDREALLAYVEGQGARQTAQVLLECVTSPAKKDDLRQLPRVPGGQERAAHRREPGRRGRQPQPEPTSPR